MLKAYMFRYSDGQERIKVVGPPDHDGWVRVFLHINVETGEVKPGEGGPGRDVMWQPGMKILLDSGDVVELA